MRFLILLIFPFFIPSSKNWGFFAHKEINFYATFTLPPEMIGFYKSNIQFIKEEAVAADKRRYAIEEEGIRHYIDLDAYSSLPPYDWELAKEKLTEDTLNKYGILPWNLIRLKKLLTRAFKEKEAEKILRLSADIGHYIADAHVPLHTTKNYNGQLTGQEGIHGFWESRLPELFFENYDLITGKAKYYNDLNSFIWETVKKTHNSVDSVLSLEKSLSAQFPPSKKYSFETRGSRTIKVYSRQYSKQYHDLLQGMVENQIKKSIHAVGSFWYSCWIDAGQPEINKLTFKWANNQTSHSTLELESCH